MFDAILNTIPYPRGGGGGIKNSGSVPNKIKIEKKLTQQNH